MPCFLIGAFINYFVIYLMLNLELNTENNYMLYVIPALWGVADSCWQTQGKRELFYIQLNCQTINIIYS
jgi:hypothetical protein